MLLLKFRRVELGISQRQLAAQSGVPQHLICWAERRRYQPTDDELDALAQALDVKPGHLLRPVKFDLHEESVA